MPHIIAVEDATMPCEESAQNAVKAALSSAKWDFKNKTITIEGEDTEQGKSETVITSYDELLNTLHEIYMDAWTAEVSFEGGEPVFEGDAEGYVDEALEDYNTHFVKLGWGQ